MFILLTLGIFLLKFLALGVVGLFLLEDLELTSQVSQATYTTYMAIGIGTFISLFFFVLGKKLLWLIVAGGLGIAYLGMYNSAPEIKEIHQNNDIQSRYFKDTETFLSRMSDVAKIFNN